MKKQALQTSDTVQRILAAARDVFSAHGFSGSTVDGIAQAAGVNKATLYYQIGDKETLYAEVIRSIIEGVADRIAKDLRQAETPVDKLRVYLRNMALAADRNPWMPRIMLWELASGGGNMPDVALQAFARILVLLSEILAEGARKGVFIKTSPVVFHLMVMGCFALYKTSVPIRARVTTLVGKKALEGDNVAGKIASEVERIIFGGVLKPSPARPAAKRSAKKR